MRRSACPAHQRRYSSGDASDHGNDAQRWGLNSITATSFCQMVLGKMNSPIFMPEASCLAERHAHPLASPSQEAAHSCFKLQLWFHSECASFKRALASNSQPHRDTLRAVTVGLKDNSLSITRMEPPDATKCAKGSDAFKRYADNLALLRGLKALREHKATLAGGGRVGGTFATAGESYVYPATWSKAGARAAFDCTDPAMPFFSFAATGKVGWSCLPQSCLARPRTSPSSAPAQAMYEWVLATVINRRKQERHILPAWVPPREADEVAGGKRRRARSAAPRSGAGEPSDDEDA